MHKTRSRDCVSARRPFYSKWSEGILELVIFTLEVGHRHTVPKPCAILYYITTVCSRLHKGRQKEMYHFLLVNLILH